MTSGARPLCSACGRPLSTCYCQHVVQIPTRTRVLILQHPREHENAIGTAKMAALCLPEAELVVGRDFSHDARVQAQVEDPTRKAILLFPGATSRDLARERPEGPVTLVVLDGTWRNANALLRENPWLDSLPRYSFAPVAPSEYRIRREPRANYVSTIEALALALGALEGDNAKFEPLLVPFRRMVDVQLEHVANNPASRRGPRRREVNALRSRVAPWVNEANLFCVAAEANVLPRSALTSDRHELIHLVAVRVADGHTFEAFIVPEHPISPSSLRHTRLSADLLNAGMSREQFRTIFREFTAGDPALCAWGQEPEQLLKREGVQVPFFGDVRKVVSNILERRSSGLDEVMLRLGVSQPPSGHGRAGQRVGMLVAIVQELQKLKRCEPNAFERSTRFEPSS